MADQMDAVVSVGHNVTAEDMIAGYRIGRFAMPYLTDFIYVWMAPKQRGILPLENLRVTRSLRKSCKRYTVTIDKAFDAVLTHCAEQPRDGEWITEQLTDNYLQLHALGYAHSVEAWDAEGRLAGGLFLVNVGGLVSGESMFHIGRDASKVALVGLVEHLRTLAQPILLDVQWRTDHLASLGVIEIPHKQYVASLVDYVNRPNVM